MINQNIVGKELQKLRKQKGISLRDLASRIGWSNYGAISSMENGKLSITDDMLEKILVKGLDLRYSEAKKLIGEWRIEENAKKFGIKNITINAEGQVIHNEGEMTINTGDFNFNK